MKIIVFSDFHGRIDNIKPIIESKKYDEYIFAGDMFGYFEASPEIIDLMIEYNVKFILGNHDLYFLREMMPEFFASRFQSYESKMISSEEYEAKYGYLYSSIEKISNTKPEFFENIDLSARFFLDGVDFFVCHGSPSNILEEYIYPDYEYFDKLFEEFQFDVLVLGHTHKNFITENNGRFIINPGSCTIPRGVGNPPTYIEFDTDKMSACVNELNQLVDYYKITRSKLALRI